MVLRAAARLALVATLCGALVAPRSAVRRRSTRRAVDDDDAAELARLDAAAEQARARAEAQPVDEADGARLRRESTAEAYFWDCVAGGRYVLVDAPLRHEVDADGSGWRGPGARAPVRARARRASPRARFLEVIEGLDRRHVVVELPKLNDALVWASLLDGRTDRQVIERRDPSPRRTTSAPRDRGPAEPVVGG
ncbi:hypothetical protein JL720_16408 [Aureococcus anophagefferens]|nr:hypothetical protein JL720_16408 [Aureococcus anophagefferens]